MQESQEMRVWSLVREDPVEEGMATHSSILAGRIPWTEDLAGYSPWSHKGLDTTEATQHACTCPYRGNILGFWWGQILEVALLVRGRHLTVLSAKMPIVPAGVDPSLLEVLLSPFYPTGMRKRSEAGNVKRKRPASLAILCIYFLQGLVPCLVKKLLFCFAAHWTRVICFIPIWGSLGV